ncbi:MAG: umuD [Ferruginibacter sp.]|nr:umuD [Ferruginibacter sp.]
MMKPVPLSLFPGAIKIPFVGTRVPAGFPSPALDHMEERINLNDELIKHPLATFVIECNGDSMIDAFIGHKTKLVIDRAIKPENGHIVLAIINGEFTVKFLKKNKHQCWLVPANKKYREIEVTEEMGMQVWGVVTYIITDSENLKRCMP